MKIGYCEVCSPGGCCLRMKTQVSCPPKYENKCVNIARKIKVGVMNKD